jgi:hypothetical protein
MEKDRIDRDAMKQIVEPPVRPPEESAAAAQGALNLLVETCRLIHSRGHSPPAERVEYLRRFTAFLDEASRLTPEPLRMEKFFSSPPAMMGREFLRDRNGFYRLHQEFLGAGEGKESLTWSAEGLDPDSIRQVHAASDELRRRGVSVWPGFFPSGNGALENYAAEAELTTGRARSRWQSMQEDIWSGRVPKGEHFYPDPVTNGRHWLVAGEARRKDLFERLRVRYEGGKRPSLPGMDAVMHNPLIHAVAAAYFRAKPHLEYMLCERVNPDPEFQGRPANPALERNWFAPGMNAWHIDSIFQRLKVFVLLDDTGPENAPTRIRPFSHHAVCAGFGDLLHRTFLEGRSGAYPTLEQIRATDYMPDALLTGKKGDVIFLDPWVLHSATPCLEGRRLNLVHSFIADNPMTRTFEHLSAGLFI